MGTNWPKRRYWHINFPLVNLWGNKWICSDGAAPLSCGYIAQRINNWNIIMPSSCCFYSTPRPCTQLPQIVHANDDDVANGHAWVGSTHRIGCIPDGLGCMMGWVGLGWVGSTKSKVGVGWVEFGLLWESMADAGWHDFGKKWLA